MEGLSGLFLRVLAVSAGCSAVLAPVLLLAPRIQKKVAARSFYVLFLLLALRLMLPFEVSLPAPAVRVPVPEEVTVPAPRPAAPAQSVQTPAVQYPAAGNPQAVGIPAVRPAAQTAPAARKVPVLHIAAAVWAAGTAACALWSMAWYTAARRKLLNSSVSAMERDIQLMDRLRGELGVKRPVRLRVSIAASTPLALGLLRPTILLPGRETPELVLRHELTHIRRRDIAYKLALSLACWVNWFNPLVWLMDRAARQNLELCCDDEAVRDLPDTERRRYADMLLDAAQTVRPIPFSTCFSGGKVQMKERLVNLFTNKKNSAALVCLVLAAALLAGGLVACERAGASGAPGLTAENRARRTQLKEYFDANYTADTASVVLADLTGDGLEELLVLTLDPDAAEPPSMRGELVRFSYGSIEYFGVDGDAVVRYPAASAVSSSHAGWGYVYLVPWEAGWAIADFRPYIGQGMADYDYSIYTLGEDGEFAAREQEEVFFQIDQDSLMGQDMGGNSATEDVERFFGRWSVLRDSGVPLLTYYAYDDTEISYLSVSPADAFGGAVKMTVPELLVRVVGSGAPSLFPKPESDPATPEEALDQLEAGLTPASFYSDGFVFRLPNYEGTWDVQIFGWARMEDGGEPVPVRYLEDEEWVSGRRYDVNTGAPWFSTPSLSFTPGTDSPSEAWVITADEGRKHMTLPPHDTNGAMKTREIWFDELTLWAQATAPDGTSKSRTIDLNALIEEYAWKSLVDMGCTPAEIPTPPEDVATSYLETIARRMYLYEEGSELKYTAYWGGISQVVSYIPNREYVLYEGHTLSQYEIMDRLIYKQDGANALKYLWMAERGPMEDVSISYTVERVQTRGDSALVDITEDIQFRCQGQTELSQSTIRYQIDLVQCEGKWLVADVNHRGHSMEWCDSKDEESACALTGLPHSIKWFGFWFGTAAGHEELLGKVLNGNNSKLPCGCLAGRVLEDGTIELVCDLVNGEMYRMTVRLLADDSVEILSATPWAA